MDSDPYRAHKMPFAAISAGNRFCLTVANAHDSLAKSLTLRLFRRPACDQPINLPSIKRAGSTILHSIQDKIRCFSISHDATTHAQFTVMRAVFSTTINRKTPHRHSI